MGEVLMFGVVRNAEVCDATEGGLCAIAGDINSSQRSEVKSQKLAEFQLNGSSPL